MNGLSVDSIALGNWPLDSGEQLRDAHLCIAYAGNLATDKSNVLVYPTHFSGNHESNIPMVGPGRPIDTNRYFVVIPNLFGNGFSSSPSNAHPSQKNDRFPLVTCYDNVRAQQYALNKRWGIESVYGAYGWSMGGQQALHWATLFPDRVQKVICCCGSARTSTFNRLFLEGVSAALRADSSLSFQHPNPIKGLRAFGRVYAGWAYSYDFFAQEKYRELGFVDLESLLEHWENDHRDWNAYDLLAMLNTWQCADIAALPKFEGKLTTALRSMRSKTLFLPSSSDSYFRAEENRWEANNVVGSAYEEIPSIWGHMAGGPSCQDAERDFISKQIADWFTQ